MNCYFPLFIFSLLTNFCLSQTFSGFGGSVIDDGKSFSEFKIEVKNAIKDSLSSDYGLTKVCLTLNHPRNEEITIWLISPDGISVKLTERLGGNTANYTNTCFDMKSFSYIADNRGPFTGTFRPYHHLGKINNGGKVKGIWILRIKDNIKGNQGTLLNWDIQLAGNTPVVNLLPKSSKLPIFKINTHNVLIVDNPKRVVDFELIDNPIGSDNYFSDTPSLSGKIGIELRGSSSQYFAKKSFGFEFVDDQFNEIDRSIMGFPEESDWILSANFTDKSFINNVMAYDFFRKLGHYAPRTQYVEMVIDSEYHGLYVFMEKIKRNSERVNISKLTLMDTSLSDITGGYIFKIDKFTGGNGAGWPSHLPPPTNPNGQVIYYQYHYPDPLEITEKQKKYIQAFVKTFEDSLKLGALNHTTFGWRKYADEYSFIHYFLINELSKNVDGYRLSTYLYKDKDKNGKLGKLVIGPPWDYDIAFGNANYCGGNEVTGWAYSFGNLCPGDGFQIPFWWNRLLQDSVFVNRLKCEYQNLRDNEWSNSSIQEYIDSTYSIIGNSVQSNFNLWPILGMYVWPNPQPLPTTVKGEVDELKLWLMRRLDWLDKNIPGLCTITHTEESDLDQKELKIYPNPASIKLNVLYSNPSGNINSLILYNTRGEVVLSCKAPKFPHEVDLSNLENGMYILKVMDLINIPVVTRIIVVKP